MHRKDFIRTCGYACLGTAVFGTLLTSCGGTKMVAGNLTDQGLTVPMASFLEKDQTYRKYIIVRHDKLKFPICVFRQGEHEYTAIYMQCSHQGAELQVFGDRLECPAHGSEFNNKGVVQNGPADTNLRTFAVNINKDQLNIILK